MTDLTKIDKPLKELDAETIGRLVKAYMGGKMIQFYPGVTSEEWIDTKNPSWHLNLIYRVKPELTKPSVDWSHVAKEYRFLFRDSDDCGCFSTNKPAIYDGRFKGGGDWWYAHVFASYDPGTCDWRDSLVKRPD